MASQDKAAYQTGIMTALNEGSLSVPYLLLKTYNMLELNETEVMLLIQLLGFREREQNTFPTIDELRSRMSLDQQAIARTLHRLVKSGYLSIDRNTDEVTGIHFESYNVAPLFRKMAEAASLAVSESAIPRDRPLSHANLEMTSSNLFSVFEKEFGRPLSPMECETISGWIDQDQYAEELIKAALKEAVFAGKLHFRYIDRILLEWSRHRVRTAEEAREFAKKFRGS